MPAAVAAPISTPRSGWTSTTAIICVLSGNSATMAYLGRIGSASELTGPARSEFAFADLATGERWTLALNDGALPWWVLSPGRRVPHTRPADYLAVARLLAAGPTATAAELLGAGGPLYARLWRPFLLAALNTDPAEASARLAKAVILETLARGGRACRPRVAAHGLSRAFVDPAVDYLEKRGASLFLRSSATCPRLCRRPCRSPRFRRRESDARAGRRASFSQCPARSPRRWCRSLPAPRSSMPSSMRISRSHRLRTFRRFSASSAPMWNGCSPSPTGCR